LLERRVDAVVDINPRKRGSFIPGSGVAVEQPDALLALQPDVVFVLNRMYRGEIAEMLAAQSINSDVVVV
jgi:ABC-type Fe3+-hydroxamate transport system substrate-binding protein